MCKLNNHETTETEMIICVIYNMISTIRQLLKAPFAKTYKIIKTASHAASHDLELLGGEVRI